MLVVARLIPQGQLLLIVEIITVRNNRTNNRRTRANNRQANTPSVSSTAVGRRTLPLKVIPDERTNSLLVVADNETTAKVAALVEKLDSPIDLSGGRFYVYNLRLCRCGGIV